MTCPLCLSGYPRSFGEHFNLVLGGARRLGPCTAPDEVPGPVTVDTFRERLAAWRERVRTPAVLLPAPVSAPARPEHWTDYTRGTEDAA